MLEVRRPGLQTTIQDGGRPGFGHLGVPRGGALDPPALAVANLLLGNPRDAAALEIAGGGIELVAREPTLIGLAGADLDARLLPVGRRLLPGASYRVAADATIVLNGPAGNGFRAYLALPGGIDVPPVLGSRSTCLVGHFGGLAGRPLRSGDVIEGATTRGDRPPALWPSDHTRRVAARLAGDVVAIRVLPGPALATTPSDAWALIAGRRWTVGPNSDRIGLRLDGVAVDEVESVDVLSHGVTWGSVQLPPDGQPIVLLADHQPTGGYPVVAVVIAADLPLLGQLGPTSELTFELLGTAEARRALTREREGFARAEADFEASAR
jgi:biotin-dependent carboxylase-like uncharacterized protein